MIYCAGAPLELSLHSSCGRHGLVGLRSSGMAVRLRTDPGQEVVGLRTCPVEWQFIMLRTDPDGQEIVGLRTCPVEWQFVMLRTDPDGQEVVGLRTCPVEWQFIMLRTDPDGQEIVGLRTCPVEWQFIMLRTDPDGQEIVGLRTCPVVWRRVTDPSVWTATRSGDFVVLGSHPEEQDQPPNC